MSESKRSLSRLARLTLFALSWLFIAGLTALQLAPNVPRTLLGWIMLVVVAPPLYAVGEIAAEKYAGSWGEHNVLQKTLKALVLVVGVLALLIGWFLLGV